jgi:type II secretory pathway pseudopilin PulG
MVPESRRVAMAHTNRSSGTPIVVVVAIIGLLSTVGASALGGYWANKSVERQFESQRTAEVEDLRRNVYIDFLRATTQACLAQGGQDEAKMEEAALDTVNQGALVYLLADPEVRGAVTEFTNSVVAGGDSPTSACYDFESYAAEMGVFVDAALEELEQ